MTPVKVVVGLSTVKVRAAERLPAPEKLRFSVPPYVVLPVKVIAFASASPATPAWIVPVPSESVPVPAAALFPTVTVPAESSRPPENVFTPLSTSVPVPSFVRLLLVPLTTPPRVSAPVLPTVIFRLPGRLTVPFSTRSLALVKLKLRPICTAFVSVRVPPVAASVVLLLPEPITSSPVPTAVSLPMVSVPLERLVVPEYVLFPVSVRLPVLLFVTSPVPETIPPIVVAFPPVTVRVKPCRFTAPLKTRFPDVALQLWLAPSLMPLFKVSVLVLLFVIPPLFTV